jgi:hypothetical protein
MIETSVARDGCDLEEWEREEREEGHETLFDVLASFPFKERVEMIERMAERMGV